MDQTEKNISTTESPTRLPAEQSNTGQVTARSPIYADGTPITDPKDLAMLAAMKENIRLNNEEEEELRNLPPQKPYPYGRPPEK